MTTTIKNFIFGALAITLLGSCFSINNFQSAKTLKKNQWEAGLGASGGTSFTLNADPADTLQGPDKIGLPLADVIVFGRYGLNDHVDIGLRLSALGDLGVDAKFMAIGNQESKFTLSPGVGLSTNIRFLGATNLYQIEVPLHSSYNFSDKFAVFLTPRYIGQSADVILFDLGGGWLNYVGGSVGAEFGNNIRFIIGGNYLRSLSFSELNNFNIGAGVKFRFGGQQTSTQ